jgi:DNA-binding YbaB/EbfC family protein
MKNMMDLQKMLRTAKDMQDKMQKELAGMRVEGTSGGGIVTVALDGHKRLLSLRLEPEVVNKDEIDMLQDLVVAAFNDAAAKVDEAVSQKLGGLTGGLKIPGLG